MQNKTDVSDLIRRAQRVESEVTFEMRKGMEDATKARKWLDIITAKDIEKFSAVAPMLKVIVNYTVDDIMDNKNGEKQAINTVVNQLRAHAVQTLEYFEGKIC